MKDLTQGSVTKHLLHMSAFMAVSMVVQTLYLLADLFWVGHLGKEAIAAVGVAGNLTIIVLALTQMLGVGTTALISQAAGRKDQQRAELVFNQSCAMSIWIALALGVVGFLSMDAYANSLSADANTAGLAKAYLRWFLPAMLLQFPLVSMGSALRATGIVQAPVIFQVLSVVLNMVLAPFLIFGIGPWPKLGVTGAALATFISILVADVMIILYFEKKYHYLRFRFPLWRAQMKIWASMRIGVPAGAEFILLFFYIMIVYVIIRNFGQFGSDYLRIVAFNFVAAGVVFTSSSMFQGLGNTIPPLLSSASRLVLFVLPALLLARTQGFDIKLVWYLSVGSQVLQACMNLLLLRRELHRRLRFGDGTEFIPASATAS